MTMASSCETPSKLHLLPAELLVRVLLFLDRTEDLQNVRLADRAFSKASTTVLQKCFFRLHVIPTRTSVTRFLKLTTNTMIASSITHLEILYRPPFASSAVPSAMVSASKEYDLPWPLCKEILSEFNNNCFRPVIISDAGALPQETNVIGIGTYERILEEGIERLTGLRSVLLRSGLSLPVETSSSLNLPEYLRYVDVHTGVFDAERYPAITDIARYVILRCLYMDRLSKGSPKNVFGALRVWRSGPHGQHRSLSLLSSTRRSASEWRSTRDQASQSQCLDESLANLTKVSLSLQGHRLSQTQAERLDFSGRANHDLTAGSHWYDLLRATANLKSLEIVDLAEASTGINDLLDRVFQSCTWPHLTELSVVRTDNIKLLPHRPTRASTYSMGWYLFVQEDLDNFLLRHKMILERLRLQNIFGLEQRVPPPANALQFPGFEFPDDPTPSLRALRNSLVLWKRELSKLRQIDVTVRAKARHLCENSSPFDEWLSKSDIQALATALGVEAERSDFPEGQAKCSQVDFHLAKLAGKA